MDIARLLRPIVRSASAHCDTEDGPAVADGRRALETGNVNIALRWVHEGDEGEVREAFARAVEARSRSAQEGELAGRAFLEVLIRVHRAGEGAGFEGIKPGGTPLPARVVAADEAVASGRLDPLRGLVDEDRWPELERRFERAMALKDFDVDDLPTARRFTEAYVSFFTYAEGHDHDHTP